MSNEENLIHSINQTQETKQLRKDLEEALLEIKKYETLMAEIKEEHKTTIKSFAHDLASPLQILSMTLESIEDKIPTEMSTSLERMQKSCEKMTTIILTLRKLQVLTRQDSQDKVV